MKLHLQVAGDQVGLVDSAGACPANVEFLQRHDVRRVLGDQPGDTLGRHPTVHADAAMDVIGYDPKPPSAGIPATDQRR